MATIRDDRRHAGGNKSSAPRVGDGMALPDVDPQRKGECTDKRARRARAFAADIVLLVVLAALCVGGFFGYRALKKVYDPVREVRTVEYTVRVTDVDAKTVNTVVHDEQGNSLFENSRIYHTDSANGACVGTVKHVRLNETEQSTYTLYLTVEAEVEYLEGDGYSVQDWHLLAGTTERYRVQGLSFEGFIMSLHEKS